jgi:hypothetical protein
VSSGPFTGSNILLVAVSKPWPSLGQGLALCCTAFQNMLCALHSAGMLVRGDGQRR